MWIMVDNQLLGVPYYPDASDNHNEGGTNVGFCDGRVQWVKRSKVVVNYERSEDEGRTGISIPWLDR
jgi:prepilin-type processing-associated H-X9-DG protein